MDAIMSQISLSDVLFPVITFTFGVALAALIQQMVTRAKAKTFHEDLQRQIEGAQREADNIIKAAQLEAAAENIKKKEQFTVETNQVRAELHELEMRLSKREDALDRQTEFLQQQEKVLKQQGKEVERRLHNIDNKEKQLSILTAQQKNQLLKIAAMGVEEAKDLLLK